jgi:hypothetical protein
MFSPALLRLRTVNGQIQQLPTNTTDIDALKRQIELHNSVLRDLATISSRFKNLIDCAQRGTTFSRRRRSQRRRAGRPANRIFHSREQSF